MKLIVGLGNPGEKYEKTYHNVGYMVIQMLADKLGRKLKDKECKALTLVYSKNNEKIVVALPETYMNLSGEAISGLLKKYNGTNDDLVVVYDDTDLPEGNLRLRKNGSAGTHNGMKNIVANLATTEFKRIRVGIGKKPEFMDMADFVLSNVHKDRYEDIMSAVNLASDCLVEYINGEDFDKLMQKYNTKK